LAPNVGPFKAAAVEKIIDGKSSTKYGYILALGSNEEAVKYIKM
jgi:hypothetical protein